MNTCAHLPECDSATAARALDDALAAVPLYALLRIDIHPSLSQRACWFCGCLAPHTGAYRPFDRRYHRALGKEIAAAGRKLSGRGQTASVLFGAGAPGIMNADDIAGVLDVVEVELGLTNMARLAVELMVEDVCASGIEALQSLGFGGVTLFGADAAAEGAAADAAYERLEAAVGILRDADIDDLGIAFFADLPSRSAAVLDDVTERILSLGPDRIHAHSLGERIWLDPAFRSIPAPPLHLKRLTPRILASGYGLAAPGIFVKPERRLEVAAALESRLSAATLGFGAGALTHLAGRNFRNWRTMAAYLDGAERCGGTLELSALRPA